MCLTGKSVNPVQPPLQKYSASRFTQIRTISPPSRPTRGALAIVIDAGRDAVDAAASGACGDRRAGSHGPVSGRSACRRTMLFADGKAVWSWHPLLVSSQWRLVGPTGLLDQPYSLTTVTRRIRSPGRARNKPLKPLRRECRVFRGTCGDYARVLYLFRTRGCGCIGHPAFPCALSLGGRFVQRLGCIAPRDREVVSGDCERATLSVVITRACG
jgi:hypothetical protein